MNARRSIDLTALLVLGAVLVALGHFVLLLRDLNAVFVHVDYYRYILPEALRDGLGFGLHDLINSLQLRSPGEFRPRFLAYLIQAYDMKIRLLLHPLMVVHPTVAPVAWTLQTVVALAALYRLLLNLTGDRLAALASVAVYGTAMGFLSGFTMGLLQGKTLSNVVMILALWLASEAARRLGPGRLLMDAPRWITLALGMVLFLGLFLDELPVFAFVLVPIVFFGLFVRWPPRLADLKPMIVNGAVFAMPALAFLLVVVLAVPPLTERFFGFRFDYLGNTLAVGENRRGAVSFLQGPYASLTPTVVWDNFATLTGMSLADWRVTPLITSRFGNYPGGQENNLPKLATLLVFFGVAVWLAWRLRGPLATYLRGALAALALFIVFLSVLLIRHIPVATGFYYGAAFATIFSLLVGLMVKGVAVWSPRLRPVAAVAVLAIVLIQIDNFAQVNAGWLRTHHEELTRPAFADQLRLKPPGRFDGAELQAMREAWLAGDLERYVRRNSISVEAVYLLFELRAIDKSGDR
jgi:hypothetical protein